MYDIAFIVISFNAEDTILECLESIRYQVENYKNGNSVQIIISDDGSKDRTQQYIKHYIREYGKVFDCVDCIFSEKNEGTCKSVIKAYKKKKADNIYLIAGDDMFTNTDVIKRVINLKADSVIHCPPLKFDKKGIIYDKRKYLYPIWNSFLDFTKMKDLVLCGCPIINGSLIGSKLRSDKSIKFIDNFILLDDWSMYVKAFETEYFRVSSSYDPILLYRLSDSQVTNKNSKSHLLVQKDVRRLLSYNLSRTKDSISRIKIRFALLENKYDNGLNNIIKIINPWHVFLWISIHILNRKKINYVYDAFFNTVKKNKIDDYMRSIEKKVGEMRREFDS